MHKILYLSLLLLLLSCYQPERRCSDFKNGKFKYEALVNGELQKTIFIRNDSIQIEIYQGQTDTSQVRWINKCEFILKPVNPESLLEQYQLHFKIISTTNNAYKFQYNVVGETQKEIGRAERID